MVVHLQAHLAADGQVRHAHKHVERVGYAAVGGVFHRHHAEVAMPAVHFLEDGGDAAHGHQINGLTEPFDGGQMTEGEFWPQVRDLEHLLQGAGAAHDLAENRAHGGGIERPARFLVQLQHMFEDLLLAGGGEHFLTRLGLQPADLAGMGCTLIDQLDDLLIQLVNLVADNLQLGQGFGARSGCGSCRGRFIFLGHDGASPNFEECLSVRKVQSNSCFYRKKHAFSQTPGRQRPPTLASL